MITEERTSTILIVDDDEDMRDLLRMTFEFDGFTVIGEVPNGAEAVIMVMKLQPEFIVLDEQMPIQDGAKTAEMVRSIAPDTRIVAFSGLIGERPHWADTFLSKDRVQEISPLIALLAS